MSEQAGQPDPRQQYPVDPGNAPAELPVWVGVGPYSPGKAFATIRQPGTTVTMILNRDQCQQFADAFATAAKSISGLIVPGSLNGTIPGGPS